MISIMRKFNIVLPSYEKFKKSGSEEVDYIKLLKYYL